MKTKCPSCGTISELTLPVLLGVCLCGALIRARVDGFSSEPVENLNTPLVDHYAILGVTKQASDSDIKSAYRRRVKECHPDVGGDAEEFRLVQVAYETIGDPSRRRQYDGAGRRTTVGPESVHVPDLIGQNVVQAVKTGSECGFVIRVAVVEVPHRSPLSGRVVGQYPYPNSRVIQPIIGLIVAVQSSSTVWQRLKTVALDFATGFWGGLKNSTVGTGSGPRAIGSGSGVQQAGETVGEVIGTVAVAAVETVVTTVGCIVKIYIFFGWLLLIGLTLVMLSVAPAIGVVMLMLVGFLAYRRISKSQT